MSTTTTHFPSLFVVTTFIIIILLDIYNASTITNPFTQSTEQFISSLLLTSIYQYKNISPLCNNSLISAFTHKDKVFLNKFISDSAKNKNNFSSYLDCLSIDYTSINDNLTYIIIHIGKKDASQIEQQEKYLFGLCYPKKYDEHEYKNIFSIVNSNFELFDNLHYDDITVYDMSKNRSSLKYLFNCIPIALIIILILCSVFHSIPILLLYFFMYKNNSEPQERIIYCFSVSTNTEELVDNNDNGKTIVTNDTGLSFLKGLRALSMISVIVSLAFK